MDNDRKEDDAEENAWFAPPPPRPQSTRERKSEHHVTCDPAAVTSRPIYDGDLAGLRSGTGAPTTHSPPTA